MEIKISKQIVDDPVTICIEEKLALLSFIHPEHRIFRVHDQLRKENEQAYEPTTVAIGPYHRGKNNLRAMEEHKFRCLQQVLQINNELSLNIYVMAMRNLEERSRKCFVESINLSSDEFVEMMLLDGFFIIQFFRNYRLMKDKEDIDPNDHIFYSDQTLGCISRDLILVENQLPCFILDRLFNMTKFPPEKGYMVDLAIRCLKVVLPSDQRASSQFSVDNVNHLLGLMHKFWSHSFAEVVSQRRQQNPEAILKLDLAHVKCTTELQEAGVKFKESIQTKISLFDIKFEYGVLKIPQLSIYDGTERVFRNLIAYEQDFPRTSPTYVSEYAYFMDCLINSANDVKILRQEGIILSCLGEDEAVSTMVNKLCYHDLMSDDFIYAEIFNRLNKHCRKRRNIWCANLRRDYFTSPWSIISLAAAVFLLLLTVTQTIFSILPYVLSKS